MSTYREEVIKPGDRASRLAKQINRDSYLNNGAIRVFDQDTDGFRNPVSWLWRLPILEEMLTQLGPDNPLNSLRIAESVENDGAGGKPQFFTAVGTDEAFYQLGWEPIVMCADDQARSGRLPVAMLANEINVKNCTEANFHLVEAALHGYGAALKKSELVSITGEFAIMKFSITAFCDTGGDEQLILTWGATSLGLMRTDRLINNLRIKPRMAIVGLKDPGYGCNGGTYNTKILMYLCGNNPVAIMDIPKAREFAQLLTIPSKSYSKFMSRLNGWLPSGDVGEKIVEIKGAAHITGGGVWGKFGEILPKGVGAVLNRMPQPPEVLRLAQKYSHDTSEPLSDWAAYDIFHGACRMILVVNPEDAERVVSEAAVDGIEAQVIGETVANANNLVTIHSRFEREGRVLFSQ